MADQRHRGTHPSARLRVVQWATGNVGARALRRVIEHPQLELAGVWVHSQDKVGKDAGTLAGIGPVGITATDDIEDILSLNADCVLYMPHVNRIDEVCRILESGANIVSSRMEYQNPEGLAQADRERIAQACANGNASIHATGSSPGFITEALPLVLTSLSRRLDCLTISEFADTSTRNSPEMLFGPMMGFGTQPGASNDAMMAHMRDTFSPSLTLTAKALGFAIDEVTVNYFQGVARRDVTIAAGRVPAGTVAATKTVVSAMSEGRALINFEAIWYVSSEVDTSDGKDWNFRQSGWRMLVEGDTPLELAIGFPVAQEDYAEFTPNLTAHRPVNAIPYVCAAPPGFVTTLDLPQIIASLKG